MERLNYYLTQYIYFSDAKLHHLCIRSSVWPLENKMMNNTEILQSTNCSKTSLQDEDMENYSNLEWWLDGVGNIIICSVGIISNLVSIPVLLSKRITNVFYRTLAALAVFDTIFLTCDLLESVRRNHYPQMRICEEVPSYQTVHMYIFPKFLRPLQSIAMMASIYATIVVALGRYLAVAKPISTMVQSGKGKWKTVLIYLVPVLIFSVLFKLPIFFEFYTEWCNVDCLHGKREGGPYCSSSNNQLKTSEDINSFNVTGSKYLCL